MEVSEINRQSITNSTNSLNSVLVVEDDPGVNKLVCRNLQREGITVQSALTAADALKIIYRDPGLLLVLDYKLPDMTGTELIEKLKAEQYNIPFIAMTGFGDQKIAVEIMKLGARDYIVKDSDFIEHLPRLINRTLKQISTENMLEQAEKDKTKLEQQLRHAQKMEAVGVLAGGVAHDFNNLLTVIHGYSEFAIAEVDQGSTLYLKLEQVQRAAERAATLTRQLLLFSRKQDIEKRPVNINTTIDDMLKMLLRMIGEDITVETKFGEGIFIVEADIGSIEQVIMNIVLNARDALPEGGRLTIATENITLSEKDCLAVHNARPGAYICVSISDTGTGIDKETLQYIFDPFFTTKGEGKGTGLGLSIVYGIVKQHDGWINVYSKPGTGTTFKIYLQATELDVELKKEEILRLSDFRGNGQHILVVEDDNGIREWSIIALGANGYVVSEARNAEEAMQAFEKQRNEIAMVISDVVMPGKPGYQLAEQLLAKKPEIKVMLSSGYTGERLQSEKIRDSGFRFLQKPYTMIQLLSLVKEVLEG
jgi:signal transduction histidine kinase